MTLALTKNSHSPSTLQRQLQLSSIHDPKVNQDFDMNAELESSMLYYEQVSSCLESFLSTL